MNRRLLLTFLLLATPTRGWAYSEASILSDKASGVTLRAPYGWVLHKQTG